MVNPGKNVGGELVHVRDFYVWAEIHYLDSPTDYREFLTQESRSPVTPVESELVMLDCSWSKDFWKHWIPFTWSLVVALAICLLYFEL